MAIIKKIASQYGDDGFRDAIKAIGEEYLNIFADRIYGAYCSEFNNATYLKNIEWILRQYHASKKVILSALFFTQAEYLRSNKIHNITLYALYYSLFNALSSCMILHPHINIEKTKKISHAQVFKDIENYFIKFSIFSSPQIADLLNDLRLMRELFSYHLPLGGKLDVEGDSLTLEVLFDKLSSSLPSVLQVTNLISFISFYAWDKKIGKVIDEYSEYKSIVDDMFFSYIEVLDHLEKRPVMDSGDYSRQGYMLSNIGRPWPINWFISEKMCEELECGWGNGEDSLPHDYDITKVSNYLASVMG